MRISVLVFSLLALAAGSCTYDHAGDCSLPDEVSFSRDIQPIFDAHCTTPDCHAGAAPAGNLNLEAAQAYAALSQPGKGYLDTLTPHFSLLYAQMISVSEPMPPTGNLDDCTTGLVLRWIEQNAKNN
jgi:hypothetical protein